MQLCCETGAAEEGLTIMHIAMLVGIGLVVLAAFYFGAGLFGTSGKIGAAVFIWVWLAASIVNGFVGVYRAGIPVLNEVGAFIPIFGIPAALAWYLAYMRA
jgi:hypothetical protein